MLISGYVRVSKLRIRSPGFWILSRRVKSSTEGKIRGVKGDVVTLSRFKTSLSHLIIKHLYDLFAIIKQFADVIKCGIERTT